MIRVLCIVDCPSLHMFKKDEQYTASLTYGEDLLVSTGVFELQVRYNSITKSWKNDREDVQFQIVGDAEHY